MRIYWARILHVTYETTNANEEAMKQTHEKIAIIMRSFNDAEVIQGTLEALSKQT